MTGSRRALGARLRAGLGAASACLVLLGAVDAAALAKPAAALKGTLPPPSASSSSASSPPAPSPKGAAPSAAPAASPARAPSAPGPSGVPGAGDAAPDAGAGVVVSGGERALAEALFNEALALLEQGNAARACPKLEESQRLDAGIGTLLYLADCYRRLGRTASAWGTFLEAAYLAKSSRDEREAVALEQARALEPELSHLTIEASNVAGLEIWHDGRVLGPALWGTRLPVDPGAHRVEARAPGHQPWAIDITVSPGPTERTLRVPALLPLPSEFSAAPPVSSPRFDDAGAASAPTAAWVLVGGGAALLASGGVLALLAKRDDDAAATHCRRDASTLCNRRGVELADSARTKALAAGITAGAGAVAASVGVTWLFIAGAEPRAPTRTGALALSPRVSPGAWGLDLEGRF